MRSRAARGHPLRPRIGGPIWQNAHDLRSALAAAACHVIDEITMWYLGSVPHQPDVQADVQANVQADVQPVVAVVTG
jgi:hypothetical protein